MDKYGNIENPSVMTEAEQLGHKFPLPQMPLPVRSHLKFRYHPVVHQFTNLLMRDGKLYLAQRVRFAI